ENVHIGEPVLTLDGLRIDSLGQIHRAYDIDFAGADVQRLALIFGRVHENRLNHVWSQARISREHHRGRTGDLWSRHAGAAEFHVSVTQVKVRICRDQVITGALRRGNSRSRRDEIGLHQVVDRRSSGPVAGYDAV